MMRTGGSSSPPSGPYQGRVRGLRQGGGKKRKLSDSAAKSVLSMLSSRPKGNTPRGSTSFRRSK